MRILIAATHLQSAGDGVSKYALTLTEGLQRRGHQIWLVSSNQLPPKVRTKLDIPHLILPVNQHEKSFPNAIKSIRSLRAFAKQENLDIIHSQHRWLGLLSWMALWGLPTKLVSTAHSLLYGKRRYTKWGEQIIAVSESGRKHLIDYFGVSPENITIIHNAVQVAPASAHEISAVKHSLSLTESDMVLLNVGRLEVPKGHQYLLQAMPQLIACWPQLKLIIAGNGLLEAKLKRYSSHLGLDGHVLFVGLRTDISALLACADLFVLPSLWEGLPFAILEAMYQGIPVVATAVGGVPEIIQHSQTGWLVQPANSTELANGIASVLVDKEVRLSVAKAGQQFVRQEFQLSQMITHTEAVYRRARAV